MPRRLYLQNIRSNRISAKLSLCSFYSGAARLSSQLGAPRCRCHSNHSNHFILWDSTRQGLPGCAIIRDTQLEKTQREGYSKHKSSDLTTARVAVVGKEREWPDNPTPQAPPEKGRPLIGTTVQIIKFSSFIHNSCWSLPWFGFFWHQHS